MTAPRDGNRERDPYVRIRLHRMRRCGKSRTMELPDVKCLKCGTLNEPGATRCLSCGAAFAAPGAPGSKVAVKAKAVQ